MKRITCLLLMFLLLLSFQGCNKSEVNIQSTNLGDIKIDDIFIGESINKIDFHKYTAGEIHSEPYKYVFDEIIVDEDEKNNTVKYIYSRFDEDHTVISINDNTDLKTINDITNILGTNCNEKWENREEGLKSRIYYDTMRNIKAEFIYLSNDDSLLWIDVSRLN